MLAAPKHLSEPFLWLGQENPWCRTESLLKRFPIFLPALPSPSKMYRIPTKEGHSWKYFKTFTFSIGTKSHLDFLYFFFLCVLEILSNQWTLLMNRYSYGFLILLWNPVPVKSYNATMVSYRIEKHHQVCTNFAVSEETAPEWGHGSPLNSVNS